MAFTICHYCDYCAIISFKCSQEMLGVRWIIGYLNYIQWPLLYRTLKRGKLSKFYLLHLFILFLLLLYLDNTKTNLSRLQSMWSHVKWTRKGSNHSMFIIPLISSCVCRCTENHNLNTCIYCFIQMTYCFCNDVHILVSMPWRMF